MKRLMIISLAALTVAACSKEASGPMMNGNYPADNVVRIATSVKTATRANTSEYNAYPLSLTLDYSADMNAMNYTQTNVKWTPTVAEGTTTWTPERQMLWYNPTTKAQLYAYAPYQEGVTDIATVRFKIPRDQTASLAPADLVTWSASDFVPGSSLTELKAVPIVFDHKLVKFTVVLTYGNEFNDYPLGHTPSKVAFLSPVDSVNLDMIMNAIIPYVNETSSETLMRTGDTPDTYEAIVAPQSIVKDTPMISLNIYNGLVTNTFVYNASENFELSRGHAYRLPLRVGKDKIIMGPLTVEAWGDGGEIPGGEGEIVTKLPKTYTGILRTK